MFQRISKLVTASGMAAALTVGALPKPAAADTQSTLNTILGAAALVGGIILYNNYQHKRQAANTIVGYTRNGGTIYGDGRIVMPNGQTIYPNSNGQYPGGQYAYYNPRANGYTYDYQRTGQYDATHRHGTYWARAQQSHFSRPQAQYEQQQRMQANSYQHAQYQHAQYQHTQTQTHYTQPQQAQAGRWTENHAAQGHQHGPPAGARPPNHGHEDDNGDNHHH